MSETKPAETKPAIKAHPLRSKVQAIQATTKLLYQLDARAFLISVSTGVSQSVFYPLLLLIVWKGFSLLTASGARIPDLVHQGIFLLAGLFGLLVVQHMLRVVNETATSILQAVSSQQTNARLMSKMSEIPYRYFEENDFQARYGLVISQASYRPGMLVQTFISSLTALVALLAIAATLSALAPLLVVLLLVLVPLTIVEARFHRRTLGLQLDSAPDLFRMLYLSQKSIDATWQRDIRVHNSSILDEEYRMLAQRYLSNLKRLMRRFQVIRVGMGTIVAATMALATGVVFWLAAQRPAGVAELVILLPALYLGLNQGKEFSFSWGGLVECLGYIEQVFDFLNQSFAKMPERVQPVPAALVRIVNKAKIDDPPLQAVAVQLHTVSYKYPHTDRTALSEISYTFPSGTTAIVGPNGAGKSTLVKLLTGLLTPSSGTIRIESPDGRCFSPEEVRKAVLFQEPSHLYLTIRQNITMRFDTILGEDTAIWIALERAGLGRVVRDLPNGIDTLVGAGFGGSTDLSGGQWQRLALARLIYQDAPVIILDEPVASLDPQGERAVFELFAHLAQSKVIIFTTHRYDSIPRNTKISVLVDGIFTESGTHEALLQRQSDYWSLYTAHIRDKEVPCA